MDSRVPRITPQQQNRSWRFRLKSRVSLSLQVSLEFELVHDTRLSRVSGALNSSGS